MKKFDPMTLGRPKRPIRKIVLTEIDGDPELSFRKPDTPQVFAAKEMANQFLEQRKTEGPFFVDGEPVESSGEFALTCAILSLSQSVENEEDRFSMYDFMALSVTRPGAFESILGLLQEFFEGEQGNLLRAVQND